MIFSIHKNIIVLAAFVIPYLSFSQKSYAEHLKSIIDINEIKDKDFSYSLEYKRKSNNDTLTFNYYIEVSNFGENLSYNTQFDESLIEVYNNNILLNANLTTKEYTLAVKSNKEICSESRFIFRPLIDKNFNKIILDDSVRISKLADSAEYSAYKVNFLYPGDLQELYYTIFVSKLDSKITKYTLNAKIAGISLWESWKLVHINILDSDSSAHLSRDKFLQIVESFRPKCSDNIEREKERKDSLDNFYNNLPYQKLISISNDTIRLSDLHSKFYLIDFWYRSCFPCIKSLPVIKELYSKFDENQLKIISINNIDNSLEMIKEFAQTNNIEYDIYTRTIEAGKSFGEIVSYPTFLIYNKEYKIIVVINGYSEN